jgi:hypothetical protein
MSIEVEGPGGVIVEFPDGTAPDVMSAAMRKKFALSMGPSATPQSAGPEEPQFDAMGNPTGATAPAASAPSSMPYGEQMQNVVGSPAQAIANGMTFGFADKGVAGLRALSGDAPDYATALAQERAKSEGAGSSIPGGNTLLKGAGAALTGAGLLGSGLSLGGAAMSAGRGLLPRALGFGADAAAQGALQGIGNTDNGSVSDYAKAAGTGAATGFGLGATLPVAGAAVGAAYRNAAPFFTRPIPGMTRGATGLLSNAITPEGAAALDSLGPAAVLADATPGTQGLAQGIAAKADAPAGTMVNTLRARQLAAPTRLNADLEGNLGPAMSPVELNSAMDARIAAAAPAQRAAVDSAPAVMPTDALSEIGNRLVREPAGPMRNALERARAMLAPEVNGVPVPITDARVLLRARQNLDDMINYGDPLAGLSPGAASGEGGPLLAVRRALDRTLKDNIPGLSSADLSIATANRGKDAVEIGRKALGGGENVVFPQDLAASFGQMPLEQQALTRAGARASIQGKVGTNPNDLASLRRTFGDVEDFNRAKSNTLFGEQPTQNMLSAIDRETTFANTANPAISGSRTTPMAEASKAIDEAQTPRNFVIPKNVTSLGLLLHGGEVGIRKAADVLAGASGAMTRDQLARTLLMSPDQARPIVQGLLADQLIRAQRGQAISGLLGNPVLARGLLSSYANQQNRQ